MSSKQNVAKIGYSGWTKVAFRILIVYPTVPDKRPVYVEEASYSKLPNNRVGPNDRVCGKK